MSDLPLKESEPKRRKLMPDDGTPTPPPTQSSPPTILSPTPVRQATPVAVSSPRTGSSPTTTYIDTFRKMHAAGDALSKKMLQVVSHFWNDVSFANDDPDEPLVRVVNAQETCEVEFTDAQNNDYVLTFLRWTDDTNLEQYIPVYIQMVADQHDGFLMDVRKPDDVQFHEEADLELWANCARSYDPSKPPLFRAFMRTLEDYIIPCIPPELASDAEESGKEEK